MFKIIYIYNNTLNGREETRVIGKVNMYLFLFNNTHCCLMLVTYTPQYDPLTFCTE